MPTIAEVLRAMADYVDHHASGTTSDSHLQISEDQRAGKTEKIRLVVQELSRLADAAETRKIGYREYDALKDRLYAFGFPVPAELTRDVAAAFREAEGPMKPLSPGWLK